MSIDYFTLPLRLDKVMKGEPLERCSLKESINQHLHLIITTAFGEMQQDEEFGCSIWDFDFDNLRSYNKIREKIKISVQQSVSKYEQRLEAVSVDVFIKEQELNTTLNGRHVKKRLDIQISGVNKLTNERFVFQDSFFTGPLSYY